MSIIFIPSTLMRSISMMMDEEQSLAIAAHSCNICKITRQRAVSITKNIEKNQDHGPERTCIIFDNLIHKYLFHINHQQMVKSCSYIHVYTYIKNKSIKQIIQKHQSCMEQLNNSRVLKKGNYRLLRRSNDFKTNYILWADQSGGRKPTRILNQHMVPTILLENMVILCTLPLKSKKKQYHLNTIYETDRR